MNIPELPRPMVLSVSSAHFCNLITPSESEFSKSPYAVACPWQDLEGPLVDVMAEQIMNAKGTKWGLVTFRSKNAPSIYGQDPHNADLIRFRQELDAVNIPIERILIGEPIKIYVEFWEKTRTAHGEIGVSLSAVQIDPSKLEIPQPFSEEWRALTESKS